MEEGYSHRLPKRTLIFPHSIMLYSKSRLTFITYNSKYVLFVLKTCHGSLMNTVYQVHCQWLICMPSVLCQSYLSASPFKHPPLPTFYLHHSLISKYSPYFFNWYLYSHIPSAWNNSSKKTKLGVWTFGLKSHLC